MDFMTTFITTVALMTAITIGGVTFETSERDEIPSAEPPPTYSGGRPCSMPCVQDLDGNMVCPPC